MGNSFESRSRAPESPGKRWAKGGKLKNFLFALFATTGLSLEAQSATIDSMPDSTHARLLDEADKSKIPLQGGDGPTGNQFGAAGHEQAWAPPLPDTSTKDSAVDSVALKRTATNIAEMFVREDYDAGIPSLDATMRASGRVAAPPQPQPFGQEEPLLPTGQSSVGAAETLPGDGATAFSEPKE